MRIDAINHSMNMQPCQPGTGASPVRQAEQSFEQLLQVAEDASVSVQELVREAAEMMEMARAQLLQGLFEADQQEANNSFLPLAEKSSQLFSLNDSTGQNIDQFSALLPELRASLLEKQQPGRSGIDQMIDRVARHVSLAPDLIRSVVSAESDYVPDAVSTAGARGLMQLMPETARELGVTDSFDPLQNLLGGSRYLKQLLDKYDGDLDQSLAAYNWGQGNVDRQGLENMPAETRQYLARVKSRLDSPAG